MTKQLTAALFAYLVSLSPTCFASDGELPGTQSLKNIDALDRSTSIDLVSKAASSAEQKLKAIKAKYPRYRMVGGCIGSFKTDGAYDIGVAMVDPHTKTGVYAVALKDSKRNLILEITKFPIEFDHGGELPKPLEVLCESRTELLRIVQAYSAPRPETPAASAAIKPISYFDAVCVVPFDQLGGFVCYGYRGASKAFVKIGSWFND